jgi:hypothetical protein
MDSLYGEDTQPWFSERQRTAPARLSSSQDGADIFGLEDLAQRPPANNRRSLTTCHVLYTPRYSDVLLHTEHTRTYITI